MWSLGGSNVACNNSADFSIRSSKAAPSTHAKSRHPPAMLQARFCENFQLAVAGAGTPSCDPPSAIHFNSSHTSLAACHLFSGSLDRHFLATRSSAGGVIGCSEAIDGGSTSRIFAITLAEVLPSNAFLPV